jgi:hypothetical protein
MRDVTRILTAIEQGDAQATDELLLLVYPGIAPPGRARDGQGTRRLPALVHGKRFMCSFFSWGEPFPC